MEIKFTNYLYNEKEINITIEHKTITGITGTSLTDYIDILTQRKQGKGTILVNEEKITKENIKNYQKRISFIPNLLVIPKYVLTVNELMKQTIKQNNLIIKELGIGRPLLGIIRPKSIILAHNCVKTPRYPSG